MKQTDLVITCYQPLKIEPLSGKQPDKPLARAFPAITGLGFKAWLSAGTALGFYRDGGFIPHDTDLDIGVYALWMDQTLPHRIAVLVSTLVSLGFSPLLSVYHANQPMQLAFYDEQKIIIDLNFFYEGIENGILVNCGTGGILRKPVRFAQTESWEHLGIVYQLPTPIEEYLLLRFGPDWRTPKTKKDPWIEEAPNLERWAQ